jgi:hypothetical protein
MIVDCGRAIPKLPRAVPVIAKSSFDPDFWLIEETSDEDVEDVVEMEAGAG